MRPIPASIPFLVLCEPTGDDVPIREIQTKKGQLGPRGTSNKWRWDWKLRSIYGATFKIQISVAWTLVSATVIGGTARSIKPTTLLGYLLKWAPRQGTQQAFLDARCLHFREEDWQLQPPIH
mmetsp:Transcript_129570/g.223889  ORF Transcript_129570/g.223889 Transcript_129570/m.223889 type:complete len:122 (-) Transcript_129570:1638-2003(-)